MRMRFSTGALGLAIGLAGISLAPPLFAAAPEFFDGGGSGSTAEVAVQQAIWDAEASANAYGLYTCELVGEPAVFPQPSGSQRAFRAQVQLRCAP